ncbi:MAG TPA: ABC transporter permease [Pilimelia sp.]|nr:ABC transporter permease [Pilimelia sp.]
MAMPPLGEVSEEARLVTDADADDSPEGSGGRAIQGRSLRQIAWARLKRDRVALVGGVGVLLLVLIAIFAPLIVGLLGHPPDAQFAHKLDPLTVMGAPGFWGNAGVSGEHLFGLEPETGRDVFSRVVYGARVSLSVGFLGVLLSTLIGVTIGVAAGYFGGWFDAVVSRVMDLLLAFPQLLFAIALISVLPREMWGLGGTSLRMGILVLIIGLFGWPYIGRIVRGQTISLREREFIEAARSMGARSGYILFRELLPNMVAPILVYATLAIPTAILTEAALSFLGVGVQPPTASWGQMLGDATRFYSVDWSYMFFPGMALFLTVLAFNLFGDGLRDALDPKAH